MKLYHGTPVDLQTLTAGSWLTTDLTMAISFGITKDLDVEVCFVYIFEIPEDLLKYAGAHDDGDDDRFIVTKDVSYIKRRVYTWDEFVDMV